MNSPYLSNSPMPTPGGYSQNPLMAEQIAQNPVFAAQTTQVAHEREAQKQRWIYNYHVTGSVIGGQTGVFEIPIEQGTDFQCRWMTGNAFSYASSPATDFPMPNSVGSTEWAGDGLSVNIVETRTGKTLTDGFVAFKDLFTPGYGLNFQYPFPWKHFFYRNSKIRFDVRNRDNGQRTHTFSITLNGYKVMTPEG